MAEKRAMMTQVHMETARYLYVQHSYYGVQIGDLGLSMWLAFTSGVTEFDLLIANAGGEVVACSNRDLRLLGLRVPEEMLGAADGYIVRMDAAGDIFREPRKIVGAPLVQLEGGETVIFGYLFVLSDMSAFHEEWRTFSGVFILIALGVMALAFVISFFATRKLTQPLNEIAGAARRFARGDFSVRVDDTGRYDEIGELTQSFNAMADTLEGSEEFRREFIANISHELKTPMTVITGFAEGLLDGTIPPENEKKYLNIIASESRRLSRLSISMLEMSSLHSASLEPKNIGSFDVSEVIRLALLSLGTKITGKQLDIEANLPEEPIMTLGDSDAITQVVYNLVDNAIKFSRQGGTLEIDLWKQGALAYVSVENQGETISEEDLPHIFDRFHKADKARSADKSGVGLGLYIVKTILDNHNQDIFVESHDGNTKFIFSLSIK
ncbi:MAG: HAMP domain-containing histidine kinase [Oscillospiraceae bacterium]|nr:HAMP domain-containing histidine kinase [Oscillospiraceae bacterium]